MASSVSEEIEAMNDKLNLLKFSEVVQHLRDTLEEEVTQLLADIDFLQVTSFACPKEIFS